MNVNRTIRLFVSSTFSDLKAERDALQREVFPRLKQLCLAKGLRFQAIDLRWGISDEAGRDNKTMRICLRELKRCQQTGPKPNFLILLGDRYGWRPLPETIPAALFLELEKRIGPVNPASATRSEREPCGQRTMFRRPEIQIDEDPEFRGNQARLAKLLRSWYRYNENAVPPAYELQPREGRYQELDVWQNEVEQPLLEVMAHKAYVLQRIPVFSALLRENINAVAIGSSATEQEIIEGALKVPDAATHVRAFFRTIEGLPNPAPRDYVETGEPAKMLRELKDRISEHIGKDNVCAYRVPWHTDRINPDDLKDFCEQAWKQLNAVVEQQIAVLTAILPDEQEEQAHRDFGKERCRHFVGRREPLERIVGYLHQGTGQPLAVIGPSGSGKSAVMAVASGGQKSEVRDQRSEIVARYIGATPASSDLIQLLRNIVGEIRKRYPVQSEGRATISERAAASRENGLPTAGPEAHALPKDAEKKPNDSEIPYEINPLVNAFHEALQRPTADKPLFIFLDALDQLTASNNAHSLAWLPSKLSDHVRLVVSAALPPVEGEAPALSCVEGSPSRSESPKPSTINHQPSSSDPRTTVMAALVARLDSARRIMLVPLTIADGEQMLTNWLADAQRTLQPLQRDAVLAAFAHEGSPLWLRTATEEAARLASWEPAPSFASTTQGLLGQVLDRLSREKEHGEKLVSRTLSYLACARHGLAEDEILDILSADKEVMADFRRRSPKSPDVDNLPVAVWVRLHGDLAFYLAEHQAQGASLLGFYHRSFLEAVTVRDLASREERQARHQHLAGWFGKQGWVLPPTTGESKAAQGNVSVFPNARKASELPWHLYKTADAADPERRQEPVWQTLVDMLCDLLLVEAKVRSELVFELQEDYQFALQSLPEVQAEMAQERQRQERASRWTKEIIEYACQWSERRAWVDAKVGVKNVVVNWIYRLFQFVISRCPGLPIPPPSCRIWTEEEIEAESRRIIVRPTRLDRLKAFAIFVEAQCYPLLEFGEHPGFVAQHAANHAPAGPVHESGSLLLQALHTPYLLRRWAANAPLNPKPALLRTLEGHCDGVTCVSVTPDGRYAVSGSYDKTLRVWDLKSGACLRILEGRGDSVSCVSVTPDGCYAVSGAGELGLEAKNIKNNDLQVWDLGSGLSLRTLEGHCDGVTCVSVTPDGRYAVSGSDDKTLRMWDLKSGTCLRILEGRGDSVSCVSVTPDGRYAVSGSRKIDIEAKNGKNNDLQVWDLGSGLSLRTLEGHCDGVTCVSVTPDGRYAVSGSDDKTLRVWDLASGACLRILEGHVSNVTRLSITPDGLRAVSLTSDIELRNNVLQVWDLGSGACLRTLGIQSEDANCVSIMSDGRRAVLGNQGTLQVWDLESGVSMRTLEGHCDGVTCVSVTPDGRRAVSGGRDETLRLWDLESGACLRTLERNSGCLWNLSVTPDGRRVVMGSSNHMVKVWDLASGACLQTLVGHNDFVSSVSVMPDGWRAVSGSWDGTLQVWDIENGEYLRELEGYIGFGSMVNVSVTPDGRRAVSGGLDDTVRVWDLESGACLRILSGHCCEVSCTSVTPDGRLAVVGLRDGTLWVWDLEHGSCLRTLEGHDACVNSVSVIPDGRFAVSGSDDKTLRVWDLKSGACLRVCCTVAPVSAVALFSRMLVVGLGAGKLLFVEIRNILLDNAVLTARRMQHIASPLFQARYAARCPMCGREFVPSVSITAAIGEIIERLTPTQAPCLDLPSAAFDDPRLLSSCPHCAHALKFNPFFVDLERHGALHNPIHFKEGKP